MSMYVYIYIYTYVCSWEVHVTGSPFAGLTQFACLCMRNAITSLVCAWGATVSCCVQLGNFLPASARLHLFISLVSIGTMEFQHAMHPFIFP